MAKTRRTYKGGAASTTITGTLTSGGTTFVIAGYTGWPYGANPFYVVIEPGTANEEKILVTRAGAADTTINVTTRGVDDTTAAQHSTGSSCFPVFTAIDADEANEMASTLTTKGDILVHDTSTFARLGVGTNNHVLKADSVAATGLAWGQVATAGIADDAITSAKIAADAVGSSEIATGAVGSDELASNAVTTVKITDANVTTAKIADSNVTTAKIQDDAVTAAKIVAGAVSTSELADTSVTTAKIADSSVTTAKIADSAVTSAKIADATIVNADISGTAAIAQTKLAGVYTDGGSTNHTITISTASPTGGAAGDIWFKYS